MNRSKIELEEMGKEAAFKYLNEGTPMNETISETTKTAGLNPHQMARVCESANITAYNSLWEKTGSGDFVFDLADQEKIAERVNTTPSLILEEVDSSIEGIKDLLSPLEEIDTVKKAEKTAHFNLLEKYMNEDRSIISKNTIRKAVHKLAMYRDILEGAIKEAEMNAYNSQKKISEMVKHAALNGENIFPFYIVARSEYPEHEKEVKELFTKVAEDLKPYNISFKEAGQKYTEDAMGNLSKAVINKKHPILKHLDTVIRNEHDCISPCKRSKDYIVSKIELLNDKLLSRKYDNGDPV